MKAVRLEQLPVPRNAVEEERIARDMMLHRERCVHRVERADIIRAEIGRGAHAGEQHGNVACLKFGQDRVEIRRCLRDRQAAQHIVRAQLHDHQVGNCAKPAQPPAQPRPPLCGGIAGDPTVSYSRRNPRATQGGLQFWREAQRGREAIAGGQAVAECPDQRCLGARIGGGRDCSEKQRDEMDNLPSLAISPKPCP